jgi:hypothetical protein
MVAKVKETMISSAVTTYPKMGNFKAIFCKLARFESNHRWLIEDRLHCNHNSDNKFQHETIIHISLYVASN